MGTKKIKKKVILVIVEGPSDETSFEWLSEVFGSYELDFQVIHGDVLVKNNTKVSNCKSRFSTELNKFLNNKLLREKKYKKSDIGLIFHLIDTDGVFIEEDSVIESKVSKIRYSENCIECKDRLRQIENMKKRKQIINVLYNTPKIVGIPYTMYFMSMNLEHVLHDKFNLIDFDVSNLSEVEIKNKTNEIKDKLSCEFESKYVDDFDGFVEFINSKEIVAGKEYKESWNFIKRGKNSLNRYTNFNLAIQKMIEMNKFDI